MDLIEQLAGNLTPSPHGAALRRLMLGATIGTAVAAVAIVAWLGTPLSAVGFTGIPAFTMKLCFGVALAGIAGVLLFISGHPGQHVGRRVTWLLLPPGLVAMTALLELANLPPALREAAFFGTSWQTCLIAVSGMSIPVFLGIVWGFGRLAPTRLRLAGLLAGFTAGSVSAILYALYCPETTASFLVSWYALGIAIAGMIGALAGPRLLRW